MSDITTTNGSSHSDVENTIEKFYRYRDDAQKFERMCNEWNIAYKAMDERWQGQYAQIESQNSLLREQVKALQSQLDAARRWNHEVNQSLSTVQAVVAEARSKANHAAYKPETSVKPVRNAGDEEPWPADRTVPSFLLSGEDKFAAEVAALASQSPEAKPDNKPDLS